MLVGLLRGQAAFNTFASSLPYTSICLLLLGDRPSPIIAVEVLHMVELGMNFIPSFLRKFELASGWNTLKNTLPRAWSPSVQTVAFHVLTGFPMPEGKTLACPQMLPVVFAALQVELDVVAGISIPDNFSRGLLLSGCSFSFTEPLRRYEFCASRRVATRTSNRSSVF